MSKKPRKQPQGKHKGARRARAPAPPWRSPPPGGSPAVRAVRRAHSVRGPPVSKKRQRQAAAERLEKQQAQQKARRKKAAERQRQAGGLPLGYAAGQRVLAVGEGNFSFARALARLLGGAGAGIVATALDAEAVVLQKYDVRPQAPPPPRASLKLAQLSGP